MRVVETLSAAFQVALRDFLASEPIQHVSSGRIGLHEYKAFLRETYYYTRENPQLQAFATAWFRGDGRNVVKPFFRHAMSEIGHDQLALNDLEALGEDTSAIPHERPLAETVALTAFPYWAIQFLNPVAYLGHLYFLEHMPTSAGEGLIAALDGAGISASAMSFIRDHATIDQHHTQLMNGYAEALIRTEQDLSDTTFAIGVTGHLYGQMVGAAFRDAAESTPRLLDPGESERRASLPQAAE